MPQLSSSVSSYSYYSNQGTWLEQFLAKPEFQQMLVTVPDSYFKESLALLGLERLDYYDQALNLILYDYCAGENGDQVEQTAGILYALAHYRYCRTPPGLQDALAMYQNAHFGKCPRVSCGANLLPYSPSNAPGEHFLAFYCVKCRTLFDLANQNRSLCIDGCFYGCDFLGMFVTTFVEVNEEYQPPQARKREIYGFEIVKCER